MKGATTITAHIRPRLAIVYDEYMTRPQACSEVCISFNKRDGTCDLFGRLKPQRLPGRTRYSRDEACINLAPIMRCKHHKKPPGDGGIVDGCGWQGPKPVKGCCPSCGSTILRKVNQ